MKTEKTEKDIPALLELLKMEAEQWPDPGSGEVSQSDLYQRLCFLTLLGLRPGGGL